VQKSVPYMQIRGGSSKGIFFHAKDLPADETERNEVIIRIMEGSLLGDLRQIDGLGGANSLTSKVAIVGPSTVPEADIDYYFVQVVVGKGRVSTHQTCGNILAGVLPFVLESKMLAAQDRTTTARINIANTGGICEVTVQTPDGQINYNGDTKIDGVMGTAAPIICNYLASVGSTCGALLPTGNAIDVIDNIPLTCIDNGMPLVIMRASDFGLFGDEGKEMLEGDEVLKTKIEGIRLQAGFKMNLGDVTNQTIPKMCLISSPKNGGVVNSRMFIPHQVHEAIGVLAAVTLASACIVPNSICSGVAIFDKNENQFSIEHPSGEFTVCLEYDVIEGEINIKKSGLIRTARLLSRGEAYY
jgi:4-oxalomesaconate tautomerase